MALETIGEEKLTWEFVRDQLIHEADKMEKSKDTSNNVEESDHTPDALFTTKQNKRKSMDKKICHYCKKPGHFALIATRNRLISKESRKNMKKMTDQR